MFKNNRPRNLQLRQAVNFPKSLKSYMLDLRTKFARIDAKVFQFEDAKVRFRHERMRFVYKQFKDVKQES